MNRSHDAMIFAREAHKDQKRKYTGNPYADHLAEVAGIVATVIPSPGLGDRMIAVAWLHDVMEDQGVAHDTLRGLFGTVVADGVRWLSDLESGNRATRKRLSRERLTKAPAWVQTIKAADLISNTASIVEHDPEFAVTYLDEKHQLLKVLTLADPRLLEMARRQIGLTVPSFSG